MKRVCLLPVALVFVVEGSARADNVVLPVAIFASGANSSLWATEVRATNPNATDLSFRVVDFIGFSANLRFQAKSFLVRGPGTRAFGAYDLLAAGQGCCCPCGNYDVSLDKSYFGAFVIDADPGLLLQAAVLTGTNQVPDQPQGHFECASWEGGYTNSNGPEACVQGAGPLLDNTGDFRPASTPIALLWLHTQPTRRTNVTLYNPDLSPSTVTLTVTPADDTSSVTSTLSVPAHSVTQLNDIFSSPPFDAVRAHNDSTAAAASAKIVASTRLYAVGWVISNQNNTVTISLPK